MRKDVPSFWGTFSLRFVTVIYAPITIHRYSRYIVLDSEMPYYHGNSLCYICSDRYTGEDVPIFFYFFKKFCYVTLHSIRSFLRICHICNYMISLFKMCGFVSSLGYILRYVCYSVTDVTKCICWKTVYFLCNI